VMRSAARASAALCFPAHSIAARVGRASSTNICMRSLQTGQDHPLSLHGVCSRSGARSRSIKRISSGSGPLSTAMSRPGFRASGLVDPRHDLSQRLAAVSLHGGNARWVANHIDQVQEAIGRGLLLENPSTYLIFPQSTLSETSFITELGRRTGCGLLLDINNVFVSATNHGFEALDYLADFLLEHVGEIHLAGRAQQAFSFSAWRSD
jgi:uncharacterized protein